MPSELGRSSPYIRRLVAALRLPVIEEPGVEADDVIGTLATQAARPGIETVIVTGDKDMMQLVDRTDHAARHHARPPHRHRRGAGALRGRAGAGPRRARADGRRDRQHPGRHGHRREDGERAGRGARSGRGDPRRASSGSSGSASAAPSACARRWRGRPSTARLSKTLATIRRDVPVALDLDALRWPGPDPATLRPLLPELEFHSLLRELVPARRGRRGGPRRSCRRPRRSRQGRRRLRGGGAVAVVADLRLDRARRRRASQRAGARGAERSGGRGRAIPRRRASSAALAPLLGDLAVEHDRRRREGAAGRAGSARGCALAGSDVRRRARVVLPQSVAGRSRLAGAGRGAARQPPRRDGGTDAAASAGRDARARAGRSRCSMERLRDARHGAAVPRPRAAARRGARRDGAGGHRASIVPALAALVGASSARRSSA